jgi:hypothetical protein
MSQTQHAQRLPQQSPRSGFSGTGVGSGFEVPWSRVGAEVEAMGACAWRQSRRMRVGAGRRGGIGASGTRRRAASMQPLSLGWWKGRPLRDWGGVWRRQSPIDTSERAVRIRSLVITARLSAESLQFFFKKYNTNVNTHTHINTHHINTHILSL